MEVSIKKEFLKTKVAFGKNAKALEERTPEELEALALLARQSNNRRMIDYFDKIPTLKELQADKTTKAITEINNETVAVQVIPPEVSQIPKQEKKAV